LLFSVLTDVVDLGIIGRQEVHSLIAVQIVGYPLSFMAAMKAAGNCLAWLQHM